MDTASLIVSHLPTGETGKQIQMRLKGLFCPQAALTHPMLSNAQYIIGIRPALDVQGSNLCVGYAIVDFVSTEHAQAILDITGKVSILPGTKQRISIDWYKSHSTPRSIDDFQIYVGRLPQDFLEYDLLQLVKRFTPSVSCAKVPKDPSTGSKLNFGFLCYPSLLHASTALKVLKSVCESTNICLEFLPVFKTSANNLNPGATDLSNTCIFISNLPYGITEVDLKNMLKTFGNTVDLSYNPAKGFCFAQFLSRESAIAALTKTSGSEFKNQKLAACWGNKAIMQERETNYLGIQLDTEDEDFCNEAIKSLIPKGKRIMTTATPGTALKHPRHDNEAIFWLSFYANDAQIRAPSLWNSFKAQ